MKKIELIVPYDKFDCKYDDKKAVLTVFDSEIKDKKAPAVIVCPGGAYFFCCEREGVPTAKEYASKNMRAFMLDYSVMPSVFPAALMELATAIKYVRENCEEYGVDPEQIYICGFSAGGHLCASMGTLYNRSFLVDALNTTEEMIKPNGMILSYPVISSGEYAHEGSFINLLGRKDVENSEYYKYVSIEKQVNKSTVPTFIWTTVNDTLVPMENSMIMVSALKDAGIDVEFHLFPVGDHGLSTGKNNALDETQDVRIGEYISDWIDLSVKFIKNRKK